MVQEGATTLQRSNVIEQGADMNDLIRDYNRSKRVAVYWARIAMDNKRDGLAWEIAARRSHEALRYALLIIA